MNKIMKRMNVDFLHGPIVKSLILFAIPILISSIFQQMYNMVDTMIVGHLLGDQALAAMGACTSISDLLVGFAVGVGNGMSVVSARSFGAGKTDLLKKSVAMTICLGTIVTVLISAGGSIILRPLLEILNTPAEIVEQSYSYVSVIVSCAMVMMAYNLSAGLLRSIGNSVIPLVFLILSSVLNVVLDIVFIATFQMGVRGAAYATIISQGVSAVLCIHYIWKKAPSLVPERRHFVYDNKLCTELLGQGISMGLMGSIVSCGTLILQSGINGFGTLIIAGHTAARKVHGICCMVVGTMSMALSTFVSQNYGAGQRERIVRAVRYMYIYNILAAVLITVGLLVFARPLVQFITGSNEPEVLDNAHMYLIIVGPFYGILGILLQLRSALLGIGEKVVPIISSVIELAGKIVFVMVFIPRFQYMAVIFCEPVVWCLMTAQLMFSYYRNPFIRGEAE